MAIPKPTLPKGTRDFGPADVQKRKYILNTIESVFKKYGYMPLETPTMENLSTLEGKYGDEGDKLLFRVLDSGEYIENAKIKINPQLSVAVQNLLTDSFLALVKQMLQRLVFEDLRDFFKLQEMFLADIKHLINSYGSNRFSDSVKDNISMFLISQKVIIIDNIRTMFVRSGISKDDDEQVINFQFRNFRENFINDLFIQVISNLSEFQNTFSSITSKDLNKYISEKGLRYDLTVPFARYVVMNRNNITFPFKRYQMQPVWRADRPQKGRYREFWQCDADVVGSDSLLNELDLIQIYDEAFTNLGIGDYDLRINNRKVLAGIAEVVKSVDVMSTIAVAIDKLDKIGEDGVRKELAEQHFTDNELNKLFGIISIKGDSVSILNRLKAELANSPEGIKGIEELLFVFNTLKQINKSINITVDFSLARGLSYYTGCIFEVVATEGSLKSSIGGGGRYDNLTGIFGLPNVSGVGISFGLDRIYDVMEELKLFPTQLRPTTTQVLFCHVDEATQYYCLPALKKLRDANIAAEIYPDVVVKKDIGKIKGVQFDYANALQIPFTAFVGQTEMEQGKFAVKNIHTGEQTICTTDEMIALINTNK